MEKLRSVSWPTAIAIAAGIAGMCVLAHMKVEVEVLIGYAGVFMSIAGAMEKLLAK